MTHRFSRIFPRGLAGILALALPFPAAAQQSAGTHCVRTVQLDISGVDDATADIGRILEITGATPIRWSVVRRTSSLPVRTVCDDSTTTPWARWFRALAADTTALHLLPVSFLGEYNGTYADDRNDGLLWAGRGLSGMLTVGATFRYGPLSLGIVPNIAYQQNRPYSFAKANNAAYSPYIYALHAGAIDWPQRMGDKAFWSYDLGQSYLRADWKGLEAGISHENLWFGPALRNPILMSNTAPGFNHFFLGTSRPVNLRYLSVDGEAIWGQLHESKYFDSDPSNDRRLIAALVFGITPAALPGLTIGGARVDLLPIPPDGLSLWHYLTDAYAAPAANPSGPNGNDQLSSLFFRWVIPRGGFEAYGEWAREDNWDRSHSPYNDLLFEPEHSQAYTIGLQDVTALGRHHLRIYGELTHLESSNTYRSGRGTVTYYVHSSLRQGYTQEGQLLGAFIGPGSDAEAIGGDLFYERGSTGLGLERIAHDNDAYYNIWAPYYYYTGHDIEISATLRQTAVLGNFLLTGHVEYAKRYNRQFLDLSPSLVYPNRLDTNVRAWLEVHWRPPTARLPLVTQR